MLERHYEKVGRVAVVFVVEVKAILEAVEPPLVVEGFFVVEVLWAEVVACGVSGMLVAAAADTHIRLAARKKRLRHERMLREKRRMSVAKESEKI